MSENHSLTDNDIKLAIVELRELLSANNNSATEKCISLALALNNLTDTISKAEVYHLTGFAFHNTGNYEEALNWYLKALDVKRNIADEKSMAGTLNNIGLVYSETSRYNEAVMFLEQSVLIKQKYNDEKSLTAGYENLGVAYQKQLKYKEAIEQFYNSLHISERNNDTYRIATTYQNIGNMHLAQGDDSEALLMFQRALSIKESSDDYQHIIQLLNNIAVANKHLGKIDTALEYYIQCLEICKSQNRHNELSAINNNIGEIFLAKNQIDKAIDAYKKSIEQASASNNQDDLMVAEMNLGIAYLKTENIEAAEQHLLSSLDRYNNSSHKQGIYHLYESLISLYEMKNEINTALSYFKVFDKLKYEQLNTENSKIINELKTKYEVEKKEKENEIHRLRNVELKDALEDLTLEKRKSEKLLLNILPEAIAYELKRTGKVKAQSYESVSVMFADIKGFTHHSEKLSPDEVVKLLDFYFQIFDAVIIEHRIEKIKTIGDAYLCVSGLPEETANHAIRLAHAAIIIRDKINAENTLRKNNNLPIFEFRFGIHSGPVIAGIVGKAKFEFDIWGDTVNTSARMEQSGEPGRINISGATYNLIKEKFNCTYRGKVEAKNKGMVDMFFVEDEL